jgi:hypothetical protein
MHVALGSGRYGAATRHTNLVTHRQKDEQEEGDN